MRHYSRRNPEPYCQCQWRSNPAENLGDVLLRVRQEISRLCRKYRCEPPECEQDYCLPASKGRKGRKSRKNPLQRWSRPLSAAVARAWLGEEEEPSPPSHSPSKYLPTPNRQILIIGGDATYVPDWMRQFQIMQLVEVDADLERQLGEFRPDLILVFVRAERPFRPSRHTYYRVQNYAKGANSERRQVPRITVNKGWSQVMQRAEELGLDWFRDAYPHRIFIPEEELQPRAPRAETRARSMVNIRRAAQFEAQGITAQDINYARTSYVLENPSHCTLCGTAIRYQFRLMFDRPDEPQPTIFFPVGSVCIMDWVEALPDSPRKITLLRELKEELEKAEAVQEEKKKASSEVRRTQQKERSAGIKQREAERKRKLAERKEQRRKEREARGGKKSKKTATQRDEPPITPPQEPLPERLQDKFRSTQQEFGWD